jgi:hypothetical protein
MNRCLPGSSASPSAKYQPVLLLLLACTLWRTAPCVAMLCVKRVCHLLGNCQLYDCFVVKRCLLAGCGPTSLSVATSQRSMAKRTVCMWHFFTCWVHCATNGNPKTRPVLRRSAAAHCNMASSIHAIISLTGVVACTAEYKNIAQASAVFAVWLSRHHRCRVVLASCSRLATIAAIVEAVSASGRSGY